MHTYQRASYGSPILTACLPSFPSVPPPRSLPCLRNQVDDDHSGEIEFPEFLKMIEYQKLQAEQAGDERDTLDAYIAMGGEPDKSGCISADKLRNTIKDFGLTIDIDALIRETDTVRGVGGEAPVLRGWRARLPRLQRGLREDRSEKNPPLLSSVRPIVSPLQDGSGSIEYDEFKEMLG